MLIMLIGVLAYAGTCVYGNFFAPGTNPGIDMPKSDEARYSLIIKNTATVILTDDYEVFGETVGQRTYILRGYWELVGNDFKYYAEDITLPEEVFGEISIKLRR
jgi:hypothetical protein